MKLTTKRNRWYFRRELFLYMIPVILIVETVDIFYHFVQCPLHPEWSAPCSVTWVLAEMYGIFLLLTIIFAIISAKMLKKVKIKIGSEFTEAIDNEVKELEAQAKEKSEVKKLKAFKQRKTTVKVDKKLDKKTTTRKSTTKDLASKK